MFFCLVAVDRKLQQMKKWKTNKNIMTHFSAKENWLRDFIFTIFRLNDFWMEILFQTFCFRLFVGWNHGNNIKTIFFVQIKILTENTSKFVCSVKFLHWIWIELEESFNQIKSKVRAFQRGTTNLRTVERHFIRSIKHLYLL